MATLTWLHLSDLHACRPRSGWDAGRITETLVQDLAGLQRDHGLRPDLIFFTGDAAFGHLGAEPGKSIEEQSGSTLWPVLRPSSFGHLSLYPGDAVPPSTSLLNFGAGQTLSNNAILPLATNADGTAAAWAAVSGNGTLHLLLDMTGYFE